MAYFWNCPICKHLNTTADADDAECSACGYHYGDDVPTVPDSPVT